MPDPRVEIKTAFQRRLNRAPMSLDLVARMAAATSAGGARGLRSPQAMSDGHVRMPRLAPVIAIVLAVLIAGSLVWIRESLTGKPKGPLHPSSRTVPWAPLPPSHQPIPQAPLASPSSIPAGTPACHSNELEGIGVGGGAATGHVDNPVVMRNRGDRLCWLEGYSDISILDGRGRVLAQATGISGRGTFFDISNDPAPVLMEPGTAALPDPQAGPGQRGVPGQAIVNVEWYDCARPQAASMELTLPGDGGRLSVPYTFTAPYSPACDAPGSARSSLARGPLSPVGATLNPQYTSVDIKMALPGTVRRGTTLDYTVTIANLSQQDYRLDPCPDYNEIVGPKSVVGEYRLNCQPVGTIRAGSRVTFAMRLDIPATAATGITTVRWSLLDFRISPSYATAEVDIV